VSAHPLAEAMTDLIKKHRENRTSNEIRLSILEKIERRASDSIHRHLVMDITAVGPMLA
jgi:hypothetical protein